MHLRLLVSVAIATALSSSSVEASPNKRTLDLPDLIADPPVEGRGVSEITWLPNAATLSFLSPGPAGESTSTELYIEDARTGAKKKILDTKSLLDLKGAHEANGTGTDGSPTLEGYQWSPDGSALLLQGDRGLWLYRLNAATLDRLTDSRDKDEFPSFSPDGTRVAFVRKSNLFVVDAKNRQETELTRDGTEHVLNGRLDWVYEEELSAHGGKAYEWAPNSQAIAFLRLDENRVPAYPLVDFLSMPHALLESQRYPNPGDPNSVPSVHVVGLDGRETATVTFEANDDLYVVPELSWLPDSSKVAYEILNREQTHLEVRLLGVRGGSSPFLEEKDPYWINVPDRINASRRGASLYFLKDGRFLWLSERSGFNHLYVGTLARPELQALTRGPWMIDNIVGVNEKSGLVYFTSTEKDPRERHISQVRSDGTGLASLTTEPGTHGGTLSEDGAFILDTFTSLTVPPRAQLLNASGKLVRVVDAPTNRLAEYTLPKTEWVECKASDGTLLHAQLTRPPDFDPTRRYPVVVYVYGGPHIQLIRNDFRRPSVWDVLSSRGYLVWTLDGRGSWGRGHAFESPIFKDMGKVELADQLEGVKYLKSLPYVDAARIGVTGWSYGGYMTLYALSHAPEVWKCGAAGDAVADWRLYDTIYTERYMRTPKENMEGYRTSSPFAAASRVRAKLLLIHGAADDNVHLNNTLHFIDALIKARIPHELQIQPGEKHSFRSGRPREARDRALLEFFERNL
jgi:dipeptidyl-peptidase-4